jgi:hypothetical protein
MGASGTWEPAGADRNVGVTWGLSLGATAGLAFEQF